jgi:predicted ArsR family transcriptional regulator
MINKQQPELSGTHAIIYTCLKLNGPLGKDGIGRRTGLDVNQCSRALPLLQRMNLVELTGFTVKSDSGRPEREWRVV